MTTESDPSQNQPDDRPSLASLRPMLRVLRAAAAIAALVFAAVAWLPQEHPPFNVAEGILLVGFGLGVLALPLLAASLALTARRRVVRLLVGLPLAGVALLVGFIWSSLLLVSRDPSWSLH